MWQVVLADNDLNVNPEVVFVSENFDHTSARTLCRGRPVGDLYIHHHTV